MNIGELSKQRTPTVFHSGTESSKESEVSVLQGKEETRESRKAANFIQQGKLAGG